MPKATALTDGQIQYALQELPGWAVVDGKLHREFRFKDFTDAFGFMVKVAIAANTMDHHPEWCNVYNRVVLDLVTHSAGNAISELDVALARKIEEFV